MKKRKKGEADVTSAMPTGANELSDDVLEHAAGGFGFKWKAFDPCDYCFSYDELIALRRYMKSVGRQDLLGGCDTDAKGYHFNTRELTKAFGCANNQFSVTKKLHQIGLKG